MTWTLAGAVILGLAASLGVALHAGRTRHRIAGDHLDHAAPGEWPAPADAGGFSNGPAGD